jgi:hypothetical protein
MPVHPFGPVVLLNRVVEPFKHRVVDWARWSDKIGQ